MKALSVKNPYASLIISGDKTMEIRSWRTDYRGELLIVSTKKPAYIVPGYENLPDGYALGIVEVVDCIPFMKKHQKAACLEGNDWSAGDFAFVLARPREVEPFPVKGKLGFYSVELPGK